MWQLSISILVEKRKVESTQEYFFVYLKYTKSEKTRESLEPVSGSKDQLFKKSGSE